MSNMLVAMVYVVVRGVVVCHADARSGDDACDGFRSACTSAQQGASLRGCAGDVAITVCVPVTVAVVVADALVVAVTLVALVPAAVLWW